MTSPAKGALPASGGPQDCRDGGSDPCRPSRPGGVCRPCTKCVPSQPSKGGPGVSPFPFGHDDLRFLQSGWSTTCAGRAFESRGSAVQVGSSPRGCEGIRADAPPSRSVRAPLVLRLPEALSSGELDFVGASPPRWARGHTLCPSVCAKWPLTFYLPVRLKCM
jgi:hypothetical protein